ncbi:MULTISPECIES: hypothetical protein [Rhizobium]|uniref:Uncharacterized protein n=1 Tax=Rhizobium phaseoli TaxID=396 RepID=A0A7X6F1E9_9HYPH|nr:MULTISPECIES: hypothetical protein [Rhizobium]MDE8757607.1 hypothetical protein [Rhizobium sp. CBK13]NKF11370.1 hypothetical protein [Rhizobium phaseoli]QPK12616.1 hypothetical protein HER27_032045 [Rhizobium phaseoli]
MTSAAAAPRNRRAGTKTNPNGVLAEVFDGVDRRSFVLRTLREAGRPIKTSDCAVALAKEVGLPSDDARLGQIGNKVSQVLDQVGMFSPLKITRYDRTSPENAK